jgi:acyl carrier protein
MLEANTYFLEALMQKLSRTLLMSLEDIDANRSTGSYGIDSLVAVDIRNWISRETQVAIPVFDILQATTLTTLAEKVVLKSPLVNKELKAGE